MPNYDFNCPCGKKFEKLAAPNTKEAKCPKCGKTATKQLSSPNVHYKCNGFYSYDKT